MKKLLGEIISSDDLKKNIFLTKDDIININNGREVIKNIISGKDKRKLLIIGPCSADFEDSLCEYANFLSNISKKVEDKIFIIMRFYTGKPRTIGGWKGLQNSEPGKKPDMLSGIENVRKIAVNLIRNYNVLLADEMLHPNLIEYMDDIYCYMAVGARSVENQYHREVASGQDIAIGMKNPTSGSLDILANSIMAGQSASSYVINPNVYETMGNKYIHGILRGGEKGPNYGIENIEKIYNLLIKKKTKNPAIIVDTNHSNSGKKAEKQIEIMEDVMKNAKYREFIKGFMVESYLYDGRGDFVDGHKRGLSLTDPCIGLENTRKFIFRMYDLL